MDRVLFVPSVAQNEWLHEILPEVSPLMLPVAGRHFFDYAMEAAQKSGFRLAGTLDWQDDQNAEDLAPTANDGLPCIRKRCTGPLPRGLNDLDRIASPFTGPVLDGLVVVWGLCLTGHMPKTLKMEPIPPAAYAETPPGIYCREGGHWMCMRPQGLSIRNVHGWYRMNFAILDNADLFTLPGYSSEANVHIGRNVGLERGVKVVPPVIIQSNTWCARNVQLDGNVIIGTGSFVGEGAHLERSIVGENTYVGAGLDLVDKIVIGRRIIDGITGTWVDMDEPGVAHGIGGVGYFGWLRPFLRFLYGTSRGRRD